MTLEMVSGGWPRWPILVLVLLLPVIAAAANTPQIARKSEELKHLQSQITKLQSELQTARGEEAVLDRALQDIDRKVGQITRRMRELNSHRLVLRAKQESLEQQRHSAQDQLNLHRDVLVNQIRAAYAMGRQERLKILLNQQDPAVVSRLMVYYDYFHQARSKQMEDITASIARLQEVEQKIAANQSQLLELQAGNEAEQQKLLEAKQERKTFLAGLQARIRSQDHELKGLKQNETQLQKLLVELQLALRDIPLEGDRHKPFPTLKGKLPWPATGLLRARFGGPRISGTLTWDGVVIRAPEGREVKAVHHGRVAFSDWFRGFGLLTIIDHGDGYMTLYGYNQTLFKETGEWVEPGETIALIGNSGGRTEPGMYFGIRHKGKPVNPKHWCRRGNGNRVGAISANPASPLVSEEFMYKATI